jgi:predicted transcriptional regulator
MGDIGSKLQRIAKKARRRRFTIIRPKYKDSKSSPVRVLLIIQWIAKKTRGRTFTITKLK